MRIVTIEREFGAGGAFIAQRLAEKLGWELWDQKITTEIARRLKCDVRAVSQREERVDTTFHRLVKAFMRGSYEEHFVGKSLEVLDAEQLSTLFEKVINDAASQGNCVIVGRGAPWFLRSRLDTFHLFVYGAFEDKVIRIMRRTGASRAEAEDMVKRVDRERAAFVTKYYNKTWPQRDLYHMMINSKIGEECVVKMVLHELDLLRTTSVAAVS